MRNVVVVGSQWGDNSGPKDQINPANNTIGTAIFSFLSSTINEYLILILFNYNKINSIVNKNDVLKLYKGLHFFMRLSRVCCIIITLGV